MGASIIDGKAQAENLRTRVSKEVLRLQLSGITPGLAVILVGEDPASRVYVRNKKRQTVDTGLRSLDYTLPASISEADLLGLIETLNADSLIDGILVQLPLPPHLNPQRVIEAISPDKDVDGFHPVNAGRLITGGDAIAPCTPLGILALIRSVGDDLVGLEAVVVGRSNIVGKPVAQLLTAASCTVTVAHSRTRDLPATCRRADILVAAVGRAELVRGDWIKPGAIVIDVGINRISGRDGSMRLVGDVAFDEARAIALAITPVPGGVGPMTIACLLHNTVQAACRRRGLQPPEI